MGIQLYVTGIPLSDTKQLLERLGAERSRTAIHTWVQKTEVQPSSGRKPDHIAGDETVIQPADQRYWLYAANDPETSEILYIRLFQKRTTERTMLFLRELRMKIPVPQATVLVDDGHHLKGARIRLGL